jgi:hypothetical protein
LPRNIQIQTTNALRLHLPLLLETVLQLLTKDLQQQNNEIVALHTQSAGLLGQQIDQNTDLVLRRMAQTGIGAIVELRETIESRGSRIQTSLIKNNCGRISSQESLMLALSAHRTELMNLNCNIKNVPYPDLVTACESDHSSDAELGVQLQELNRQLRIWCEILVRRSVGC